MYFLGGAGPSAYSETICQQMVLSSSIGPGKFDDFFWVRQTAMEEYLAELGLEEAEESEANDGGKQDCLGKGRRLASLIFGLRFRLLALGLCR